MLSKKRILIILNYYVPYISGVTEYARMEAEMLAKEGYQVTVLASNHDDLKPYEEINGVYVYRADVMLKISKGVISPQFITMARRLARQADVVNLHCPMLESGLLSLLIPHKKIVTMYQCDVNLPKSFLNTKIVKIMDLSHRICFGRSRAITVTSIDYAAHSRIAGSYIGKMKGIAAPVKEYFPVHIDGREEPGRNQIIGFCGRIVEEKGIDVLIRAYAELKRKTPKLELRIAGDYKAVAGGSIYDSLIRYIREHHVKGVSFLGKLPEEEMPRFFSGLDVFVLPSVNSLEAYGMVQIEAMRCGAPVVSTDLYGVRTIVQNTGGGLVSKKGDPRDLARCIEEVLTNREKYVRSIPEIERYYSNRRWIRAYKKVLFGE